MTWSAHWFLFLSGSFSSLIGVFRVTPNAGWIKLKKARKSKITPSYRKLFLILGTTSNYKQSLKIYSYLNSPCRFYTFIKNNSILRPTIQNYKTNWGNNFKCCFVDCKQPTDDSVVIEKILPDFTIRSQCPVKTINQKRHCKDCPQSDIDIRE